MKDQQYNGIEEVARLMEEPLDVDNFSVLQRQLARSEAWVGRVSFQYRNAEMLLSKLKKQYLLPKDKQWTDMDRTISLDSATREQQVIVDLLKDQAEMLKNRISLGQSLMSSQRQEMKSQLR